MQQTVNVLSIQRLGPDDKARIAAVDPKNPAGRRRRLV